MLWQVGANARTQLLLEATSVSRTNVCNGIESAVVCRCVWIVPADHQDMHICMPYIQACVHILLRVLQQGSSGQQS